MKKKRNEFEERLVAMYNDKLVKKGLLGLCTTILFLTVMAIYMLPDSARYYYSSQIKITWIVSISLTVISLVLILFVSKIRAAVYLYFSMVLMYLCLLILIYSCIFYFYRVDITMETESILIPMVVIFFCIVMVISFFLFKSKKVNFDEEYMPKDKPLYGIAYSVTYFVFYVLWRIFAKGDSGFSAIEFLLGYGMEIVSVSGFAKYKYKKRKLKC